MSTNLCNNSLAVLLYKENVRRLDFINSSHVISPNPYTFVISTKISWILLKWSKKGDQDAAFQAAIFYLKEEDYKKANQYVLRVDNDKIPELNLALFIDVTYKGEDKSFYMYFNSTHRTFTANEKLDLDQLTIKKITAYEEVEKNRGSSCTNTNSTLWILLICFFALILGAILTPVLITSSARRRR